MSRAGISHYMTSGMVPWGMSRVLLPLLLVSAKAARLKIANCSISSSESSGVLATDCPLVEQGCSCADTRRELEDVKKELNQSCEACSRSESKYPLVNFAGADSGLTTSPGVLSKTSGSDSWDSKAWTSLDIESRSSPRRGVAFRCSTTGHQMISLGHGAPKTLTLLRTIFETNFVEGSDGADAPFRECAGPLEAVRMS